MTPREVKLALRAKAEQVRDYNIPDSKPYREGFAQLLENAAQLLEAPNVLAAAERIAELVSGSTALSTAVRDAKMRKLVEVAGAAARVAAGHTMHPYESEEQCEAWKALWKALKEMNG